VQGGRGGQVGLGPSQKSSMGSSLFAAHKVFDDMAERKMFSKF
jgi:hypothetical protein